MAPFVDPQWEIILLHSNELLPNNQPLAIAENCFLSPNPRSQFTWNMWVASGDHLCALDPPERLAPFKFDNERGRYTVPKLSLLAVVINAHSKLQQFILNHRSLASPRVELFAKLILDLFEEIFLCRLDIPRLLLRFLTRSHYRYRLRSRRVTWTHQIHLPPWNRQ